MPSGLFQGQGTTEQASAVGINSLQIGPGSPVMNRMEAGGETGGDRNQGVPGVTGQANPGALSCLWCSGLKTVCRPRRAPVLPKGSKAQVGQSLKTTWRRAGPQLRAKNCSLKTVRRRRWATIKAQVSQKLLSKDCLPAAAAVQRSLFLHQSVKELRHARSKRETRNKNQRKPNKNKQANEPKTTNTKHTDKKNQNTTNTTNPFAAGDK